MSDDFMSAIQALVFGAIPGQKWIMNMGPILGGCSEMDI
jgi:hypothetical protein